jgi:hypothetical protein
LFFHVKAAYQTVMWCNCWHTLKEGKAGTLVYFPLSKK